MGLLQIFLILQERQGAKENIYGLTSKRKRIKTSTLSFRGNNSKEIEEVRE